MRRADRLFQLIQILRRSREPVTAAALASELEKSQRSVYRDIAALIGQRVPIRGEAGIGYVLEGGFDLPPLINSGLGLLHRASLRFDWVEEFLGLPDILSHSHQIEQTLIALCSARFGFEMLPAEYDVHLGPRRPGAPIRHYTGPIRHLMFSEGIRTLARQGFLKSAN